MSDDAPITPSEPATEIVTPASKRSRAGVPVAAIVLAIVAVGVFVTMLSGGGSEAKKTASQFINDMSAGNLEAARSLCTADVDFDEMSREAKRMDEWGKLVDAPLTARKIKEGQYDVGGNLEFANIRKFFNATLVKQPDGSYRISAVKYQ